MLACTSGVVVVERLQGQFVGLRAQEGFQRLGGSPAPSQPTVDQQVANRAKGLRARNAGGHQQANRRMLLLVVQLVQKRLVVSQPTDRLDPLQILRHGG